MKFTILRHVCCVYVMCPILKFERMGAKKEKEGVLSCKLVPDSCLPSIKLLTARWQDLHIYGQSALGGHGDASKADTE